MPRTDHADAAERLRAAHQRGWGCRLKPRHVAAMAEHLDLWVARGVDRGLRARIEFQSEDGRGVHLSPGEVSRLAICVRCGGDGDFSPAPDCHPELCPDCGGSGWGRA